MANDQILFHITSMQEAEEAARAGEYAPKAFDREGFIHCSYPPQVCAVANRLFAGRGDLVLFEVDRTQVPSPVVDENLEGGLELFPHIYGRLPMRAVVAVHRFPCNAGGRFEVLPQNTV
jgi:uncharacterized protein (DUF952 family)